MSEITNISWCDSTVNFWTGCTMVPVNGKLDDSGCLNCYAKALAERFGWARWGKGQKRHKFDGAVKQAFALNRRPWVCDECGAAYTDVEFHDPAPTKDMCSCMASCHRRRIFSLSLGDWLDRDGVSVAMRTEMLRTVWECNSVIWILCSKRLSDWRACLMEVIESITDGTGTDGGFWQWLVDWVGGKAPSHVWLLASVENQQAADERIPELLKIPAAVRGLSLEPLLGPVDLSHVGFTNPQINALNGGWAVPRNTGRKMDGHRGVDWLVIGGESNGRECNVEWIRDLVRQGQAAGVAVHVKQLGSKPYTDSASANRASRFAQQGYWDTGRFYPDIKHPKGGDPSEWPEDLRVREFPGTHTR